MLSEFQILIRLLIAAGLSLIIGYERERKDNAAGLRTHMVLGVGAALAMTLSLNLALLLGTNNPAGDPTRIAASVVSGIGFLGAGVFFRYGTSVHGVTTAATLWTVAIIGLAVGAGFYIAGTAATVILLIILTLLNYIEDNVLFTYNRVHITLQASYRDYLIEEVKELLNQGKNSLGPYNIDRDIKENKITLDMLVRIVQEEKIEDVMNALAKIAGVIQVKVSE